MVVEPLQGGLVEFSSCEVNLSSCLLSLLDCVLDFQSRSEGGEVVGEIYITYYVLIKNLRV